MVSLLVFFVNRRGSNSWFSHFAFYLKYSTNLIFFSYFSLARYHMFVFIIIKILVNYLLLGVLVLASLLSKVNFIKRIYVFNNNLNFKICLRPDIWAIYTWFYGSTYCSRIRSNYQFRRHDIYMLIGNIKNIVFT